MAKKLSEPQESLVRKLKAGAKLQHDLATGLFRLQDGALGRTIHPATAQSLLAAGVLRKSMAGDLDAKFGASLQADINWVSFFFLSFCGLQFFAFALALMLVVPFMLWGIAFFFAHPEFLGEQMAHLQ